MKLILLSFFFSSQVFAAFLLPNQPATVTTALYSSVTGVLNLDMLSNTGSGWYDTLNQYGSFTADIYTTTTVTGGVITFEQTNDKTSDASGITLNLQDATVLTQTNVTTLTLAATTVKHYVASISARYVRFRISTAFAGTGTVGATVHFRNFAYVPMVQGVAQATAGSLNVTVGSGTITTVSTVTTDNIAAGTTNGCMSPGSTLITVAGTTTGTSATQIIALTAGKKIFICSMALGNSTGTTPTFSLVYGTGTNCVTGQTVIMPAFPEPAGIQDFAGPVGVTASANELCYLQTGTTPVTNYMITYTQQ
jgi:hypothetical protein